MQLPLLTSPLLGPIGEAVVSANFIDLVDDVVHPVAAKDRLDHEQAENIRVPGSHCAMTHNAFVLTVLADRLAQPQGQWQPFKYQGAAKLYFEALTPLKHLI